MKTVDVKINDIKIGNRLRKDMGDVESLARSIEEVGLLQPIGITPDHELVFGERRLRAYRDVLGRQAIPARIIPVESVLHGQIAENVMRNDFTPSEMVAIVEALRSFRHGGDRRSKQARKCDVEKLTLGEAAKLVGLGGKDGYHRAKVVVENGLPELVQAMDSGKLSVAASAEMAKLLPAQQHRLLAKGMDWTAKDVATYVKRREAKRGREPGTRAPVGATIQLPPLDINSVLIGDCRDLISLLPDASINLCLCSPPYADQRKGRYPGVPEKDYPTFTVEWMTKLWDKLTNDGSVLIVIDPHVKNGMMADYVLRTQLALREAGWKEHQTLIWHKPDRGPLGHRGWPRHTYEQVLWFSKTKKPFCNPTACGTPYKNLAIRKIRHSRWSPGGKPEKLGTARVSDVLRVPVGKNEKGIDHPAMFPVELAEILIATFCPKDGTVLDPFAGSGSTLVAAKRLGRSYYGFDMVARFCRIARRRLAKIPEGEVPLPKAG